MITLNLIAIDGSIFASKKLKAEEIKVGTRRRLKNWADKQDLKYGSYLRRQWIGMESWEIP